MKVAPQKILLNAHLHKPVARVSHALQPDPLRTKRWGHACASPTVRPRAVAVVSIAASLVSSTLRGGAPQTAVSLRRRLRQYRTVRHAHTRRDGASLDRVDVQIIVATPLVGLLQAICGRGRCKRLRCRSSGCEATGAIEIRPCGSPLRRK